MKNYVIDLTGVRGPVDVQQRIADGLAAPDWYGGNLDALFDLLGERQGTVQIIGVQKAAWIMPGYMRKLERVCRAAAGENETLSIILEENGGKI